jgi:hypothetical protein
MNGVFAYGIVNSIVKGAWMVYYSRQEEQPNPWPLAPVQ